jgi:ribosomal protein L11 methylase PrmA
MTAFDDAERRMRAGTAEAFGRSYARVCAYPVSLLLDAAGVGAGANVLDAGTGTGTVAVAACARGATVAAVDADPDMVRLAREAAPGAQVSVATLPRLPFADEQFDAVVANFVLNTSAGRWRRCASCGGWPGREEGSPPPSGHIRRATGRN